MPTGWRGRDRRDALRLRQAREDDVDAACELLETAFGREGEARLFRALMEGDELALALVAVGPVVGKTDPGTTVGAATPPDMLLSRRDTPSRSTGAGSGTPVPRRETAEGGDEPLLGLAVLSRLLSPKGAVGLGPLAVRPECSDLGIGKSLIAECVTRARRDGHTAIFVLGQPPYYTRFGFSVEAAAPFRSEYPAEFLMALELQEGALEGGGDLRYPPAFAGL